jgi:16S rRNA (guanine(966)-N(2))-methyltransferase RsmD
MDEALSRGAEKPSSLKEDRLTTIQRNLHQFGLEDQSEIIPKDVNRAIGILKQRGESFDVIFMDPPYEKGMIEKTLRKLNSHPIYCGDSLLVIEHNRREPLPNHVEGWNLIRQQRIGDTLISFLTPRKDSCSMEVEIKS